MAEKPKKLLERQATDDDEQMAERMVAYADDIRTWTKGSGHAMIQLPGEAPRLMTVDEMRAAKKRSRH